MARSLATVVAAVAGCWLVLVVLAAVFQRQLIYLPDAAPPAPPDGVEEVVLATDDGLHLTAWFLGHPDPAGTVLLLPGNAGNRGARMPMARGLHDRGHAVLLLDYRGYGGNPGSPFEDGLHADALAARAHLEQRADVDVERIAYLGESIGSGVAARLAAARPPAALILRSPFPELADVGRSAYPFLPVRMLLRDRYPVSADLEGYDGPVLVVAGERDRIVPRELSRQVAQATGARLVEIDGAGHNDLALFTGQRFLDEIDDFIRASLPERPD